MVLLLVSETWVILAEIERNVEGTHMHFLRQITGKQTRGIADGTWEMAKVEVMQEASGIQSEMTYIRRQQATMDQWVSLQPIFEVCEGKTGYKWGGHRREAR